LRLFSRFPLAVACQGYALDDMAGYMYMGLEGIYGTALGVSATYIILFVVFGAIMAKSGLGQFFNDLAMALAAFASAGLSVGGGR
jgi:TRAP-type uncharacterized transport system fused permease subunit